MRLSQVALTAALTAAAILASACGGAIPRVDPAAVTRARERWPGTTAAELELGRERYVARCSGCHSLHRPADYPPVRWAELVETMAPRARLTEEDGELIERYLATMSVSVE